MERSFSRCHPTCIAAWLIVSTVLGRLLLVTIALAGPRPPCRCPEPSPCWPRWRHQGSPLAGTSAASSPRTSGRRRTRYVTSFSAGLQGRTAHRPDSRATTRWSTSGFLACSALAGASSERRRFTANCLWRDDARGVRFNRSTANRSECARRGHAVVVRWGGHRSAQPKWATKAKARPPT